MISQSFNGTSEHDSLICL
uniref:Uncharacterized protein n=1 Tax=Rhizophora mucronata TaxID=61149 RepID=A0A2P2PEA0_RHIMU